MRGFNITNKYIIDSKEYLYSELTKDQLVYIDSLSDKTKYNNLRNQVLEEEGVEVECTIKINIVDQEMIVYDVSDVLLFKS